MVFLHTISGASVNVTSTKTMETPLHLASRRHNQQLSTLLIEYGANLGAKNNEDKKPSQVINMDLPDGEDMCDLFQYYEGELCLCSRKKKKSSTKQN